MGKAYSKKDYDKMKGLVNKYVDEAKRRLWVGFWTIDILFYEDNSEEDKTHYIEWQNEYFIATLNIEIESAITCMERDSLKSLIYHEIAHLVSSELVEASHDRYCSIDKLNLLKEQLTEKIKNIAIN